MKRNNNLNNALDINALVEKILAVMNEEPEAIATTATTEKPKASKPVASCKNKGKSKGNTKAERKLEMSIKDLLGKIHYSEEGYKKGNNALAGETPETTHFYCPNTPVYCDIVDEKSGETKSIKLADNPLARITAYIAKKWALKRDWIPDYKYKSCREDYELEDVQSIVRLGILHEIKCDVPRDKIIGDMFDLLDLTYGVARKDGGTSAYSNQDIGDILEYDRPCEYRKAVLPKKYPRTLEEKDEFFVRLVHELFVDGCISYLDEGYFTESEVARLQEVETLFKRAHDHHKFATVGTWRCAELAVLGVPRDEAIRLVYDKNGGLSAKEYRSCEVKYATHKNEVISWLLVEVARMVADGSAKELHLDKWEAVLARDRVQQEAEALLAQVVECNYIPLDKQGVALAKREIASNPEHMKSLLEDVIIKNGGTPNELPVLEIPELPTFVEVGSKKQEERVGASVSEAPMEADCIDILGIAGISI